MIRPISIAAISLAVSLAAAGSATAGPESLLLGQIGWQEFAVPGHQASLAWSGEDEATAHAVTLLTSSVAGLADEEPVDVALLTGLPAPEPPAIVLAGLAFGGVLCGRSLLRRKKTPAVEQATT